jgi:hypothetical protein
VELGTERHMIVRTQPWHKIAEFYRSIAEKNAFFQPMARLAEQIGCRSMPTVFTAGPRCRPCALPQTPEADKEVLRISLDVQSGALIFDFQETGSTLPEYQHWIRQCLPDEGFTRLEQFLRLKKWFVEYGPLSR